MKPVLFLDVDGVLNAMRQSPWAGATRTRVTPEDSAFSYQINTSKMLGHRLLELEVDIHWLTTWREEANSLIAPLAGLPKDLPVVDWEWNPSDNGSIDGKQRAVAKWRQENPYHPYIWIDDEHDMKYDLTDDRLIVGPNARYGLVPEDIDLIEQWVLQITAAVSSGDGSSSQG